MAFLHNVENQAFAAWRPWFFSQEITNKIFALFTLFGLFALFILFKLLYTVNSSVYLYVYILGKVRTLLECAVELLSKMLEWSGYPLDCCDY